MVNTFRLLILIERSSGFRRSGFRNLKASALLGPSDYLMMKSRVAEKQTPVYLTRSALIDTGEVADKILAPEIDGSSSCEIRQGINLFKPCRQQQYRDSVKNIKYNLFRKQGRT